MTPPAAPERYKNHRFPGEIINHGVWFYYRFPLDNTKGGYALDSSSRWSPNPADPAPRARS